MNQRASLRGGAVLAMIIGFVPSLLFLVGGFVGGAYIDQRFPEYVPFIGHHSTGRVDLTQVEEAARYIQADYVDTNVDPKKLSQASVQGLVSSLGDRVLYVRIYQFGSATSTEFATALKTGLPGARAVILDLRGDPGGFISAADDVITQFVTSGETFETHGRNGVDRHQVGSQHAAPAVPLAVLVDANSASAAEIVAGSLQVHNRAKLVGTTTFGKGSVQEDFGLSDGSDIHLTVERWFLPNGQTIDHKGLTPDVPVKLASASDEYDVAQPSLGYGQDGQLNAALALLTGG